MCASYSASASASSSLVFRSARSAELDPPKPFPPGLRVTREMAQEKWEFDEEEGEYDMDNA